MPTKKVSPAPKPTAPPPAAPRVEIHPLTDADPDAENANKHTQRGAKYLENSMRQRGFFRPIAAAGKGTGKPKIKAGNLTQETAVNIGMDKEAIFIYTDGKRPIVHVRTDLDPDSPEAAMLALEDNRTAEVSLDWDHDVLAAYMKGENAMLAKVLASDSPDARFLKELAAETVPLNMVDDGDYSPGGGGRGRMGGGHTIVGFGSFMASADTPLADKVAAIIKGVWGEDAQVALIKFMEWIIENENLISGTAEQAP